MSRTRRNRPYWDRWAWIDKLNGEDIDPRDAWLNGRDGKSHSALYDSYKGGGWKESYCGEDTRRHKKKMARRFSRRHVKMILMKEEF